MTTNINVENADHALIGGRDVNICLHASDQSGSSENFHELSKNSFRFTAVATEV